MEATAPQAPPAPAMPTTGTAAALAQLARESLTAAELRVVLFLAAGQADQQARPTGSATLAQAIGISRATLARAVHGSTDSPGLLARGLVRIDRTGREARLLVAGQTRILCEALQLYITGKAAPTADATAERAAPQQRDDRASAAPLQRETDERAAPMQRDAAAAPPSNSPPRIPDRSDTSNDLEASSALTRASDDDGRTAALSLSEAETTAQKVRTFLAKLTGPTQPSSARQVAAAMLRQHNAMHLAANIIEAAATVPADAASIGRLAQFARENVARFDAAADLRIRLDTLRAFGITKAADELARNYCRQHILANLRYAEDNWPKLSREARATKGVYAIRDNKARWELAHGIRTRRAELAAQRSAKTKAENASAELDARRQERAQLQAKYAELHALGEQVLAQAIDEYAAELPGFAVRDLRRRMAEQGALCAITPSRIDAVLARARAITKGTRRVDRTASQEATP